ncbi:L-seryl-tRNA(Sec) selenium transferase, partial [Actinomadura sp. CNU-125]|uniref:L-seryl-tRNA(Sec) selenium transferase n=1 Tax=Actinomadura sp. CNU-125 TaxID=1904961 RepID=UPI000ACE5EA3
PRRRRRRRGHTDVELDLATAPAPAAAAPPSTRSANWVPAAASAHVVGNGAAALVLAATALAGNREIIVSRGELVEIGDGFRIPDLLAATGARLREVGTTNRTAPDDYAAAVGPGTGFILKIHPSNFRITGFTRSAGIAELAGLGVPVVADIGSGLLEPEPLLPDEPDAQTALASGAALVTASGDKLLGGPQCGLVLGRADLVRTLARHPLARALRVGKMTLAALEATLRGPAAPTARALHADTSDLPRTAPRSSPPPSPNTASTPPPSRRGRRRRRRRTRVVLPSAAVSLPEPYAARLRLGDPAVMGRVENGRCLLDLRAVPPEDDPALTEAVRAVPGGG